MELTPKGRTLLSWRMNRGLSLEAAASEIGIHRATLEKCERGESVRAATLKRVADFYGCTVMDIVQVDVRSDAA